MARDESPRDYSHQIHIVAKLREAFQTVKHHQTWSKRLLPAFQKALPAYTFSMGTVGTSLHTLDVWGNGLPHSEHVHFCFHQSKPWAEAFAEDLDRQDCSDSAERERDEAALCPQLDDIEGAIAGLRASAHRLIEALPVPKSAKTRREPHFWTSPSSALAAKYPEIFGERRR